jgi:tetratricopeptide (TPR) repeat protein
VCGACASAPREPLKPTGGLDSHLVWRADLHARRGEDREAEEIYRKAIQEEPNSIRAHTGLQAIQKRRGRELAVRREYDSLDPDPFLMARLHPNPVLQRELYGISSEPYRSIGLGASAAGLGKIAYAKEHFENAVEMDPGNPWSRLTLGRMELAQGKLGSAAAEFRASLWTEPGHPTAAAGLSSVAARRGDLREAYRCALEAYLRAPDREGLAHRLHDLSVRTRMRTDLIEGAAQLAEGNDKSLLLAADLYTRAGEHETAAVASAKALKRGATRGELEALEREWKEPAMKAFVAAFTKGVIGRYRHYAATGEAERFDEFVGWARDLFERTTGRKLGPPGAVLAFSFVGKLVDATLGSDDPLVRACAENGMLLVLGQREGGPPEAMLADVLRREPMRRVKVRGTEVEREAVWTGRRHLAGYLEWAGGGDIAGIALARIVVVDLSGAENWAGNIHRRLRRIEPYREEVMAEPALDLPDVTGIDDPAGVADRLYMAAPFSIAAEVLVHENSHLVDAELHLPVMDHPFRNLGLLLGRGFSSEKIVAYLERNAQLSAIAEGPAPLAALATCCALLDEEGPHPKGYREIVQALVNEIYGSPDRYPEIDTGRVILQQLHRLSEEKVRSVAWELMERWGVVR